MQNSAVLLKYHAGLSDLNHHSVPSLVSTLRPFTGCIEKAFAEFMHSALLQHEHLSSQSVVNRELVLCFWSVSQTFRLMALSERSPIRRSKLGGVQSLARLTAWYESIEGFIVHALSGHRPHICFSRFTHYLCHNEIDEIDLYRFTIPILEETAKDIDYGIVEDAEEALKKFTAK